MKWNVAQYLILMIYLLPNLCAAFVETRGCNRTVRNSVGWIRWTGRMGKCIVRIKAPLKDPQVIELRIRRLQVGILKNSKCEGAYIQLSKDLEDLEDDSGRYCGHVTSNTTRLFLRRGPDLTIVMDSETKFAAENPVIFSAQYSILPARLANERHRGPSPSASECPLECSNRNDRRICRLVSPGYPGIYPRGIRCRIALESNTGRFRIGGEPEDLYNLMNYTHQDGCETENCEDFFEPEGSAFGTKSSFLEEARIRSLRNVKSKQDEEDEIIISQDNYPHEKSKVEKHRRKSKAHRMRVNSGRKRISLKTNGENASKSHESLNSDKLKRNRLSMIPSKHIKHMDHYFDHEIQPRTFDSNRFRHEGHSREKILSFDDWNPLNSDNEPLGIGIKENRDKSLNFDNESSKFRKSANTAAFLRRYRVEEKLGSSSCVGDYLALLENVNGRILEITKFCGEGRVPLILSRGRNVIIEFFARSDGTIMHDGFQLTLQETEATRLSLERSCKFVFKSSDKSRETIKSLQSWYPPNTVCTYKFIGKATEKVSVQLKIVRDELLNESNDLLKKNASSIYCTGNEITIYNDIYENNSLMVWSYCDSSHSDINNIQVPIISSGSSLMIQFYSAKGSFDGQEFTYSISYKFIKKSQNVTRRRQVTIEEPKVISLRPVNFSALNLNESEICDCNISDRIGSFKSWFMVLVVLGIISFLGAIFTIVAVLTKCLKMRAAEKRLLQTPKR